MPNPYRARRRAQCLYPPMVNRSGPTPPLARAAVPAPPRPMLPTPPLARAVPSLTSSTQGQCHRSLGLREACASVPPPAGAKPGLLVGIATCRGRDHRSRVTSSAVGSHTIGREIGREIGCARLRERKREDGVTESAGWEEKTYGFSTYIYYKPVTSPRWARWARHPFSYADLLKFLPS